MEEQRTYQFTQTDRSKIQERISEGRRLLIDLLQEQLIEDQLRLDTAPANWQRVEPSTGASTAPVLATQEALHDLGAPGMATGTRKGRGQASGKAGKGRKPAVKTAGATAGARTAAGKRKASAAASTPTTTPTPTPIPVTEGKRKMSAAGRKRIADAQKRRWAEKRQEKKRVEAEVAAEVAEVEAAVTEVSQAAS